MKLTTRLLKRLIKEELEKMDEASFVFGNPNLTIKAKVARSVGDIWMTNERIQGLEATKSSFHDRMQNPKNNRFLNNTLQNEISEIEKAIEAHIKKINKAEEFLKKHKVSYEDEIAKYEE